MADIRKEFYHGWMIQVARGPLGYTFQCWILEKQCGVTDAQPYVTVECALDAARRRADLESVRLSLSTFLHGKLQLLLLNSDERIALENSIAQYIDMASHQPS